MASSSSSYSIVYEVWSVDIDFRRVKNTKYFNNIFVTGQQNNYQSPYFDWTDLFLLDFEQTAGD